ncbi:MAG TPA: ATP-binding protein [Kofleriaceae bacterium]|nr:ATP-binding protein [Kofleriaceae bacterium]
MVGTEYRLVAEALPQLIWVTDEQGAVEYVNRRFVEYSGYASEDLLGQTAWRKTLHPDDLERCLNDWRIATTSGEPFETEYRLRRASDGCWRWHLGRAQPVKDDRGRVLQWIGTCTDIEDQKRIEERILEESRRKDEFLAMLGHELRNPLTPILAAVRLLAEHAPACASEVAIIQRQATHMARLLDDLLDLGRIERGRIELRKQPQELVGIVEQAIESTMPIIEKRRHTLVVDVADEGLTVNVDTARLAQVISNVVNNAAKYTLPGGTLTIRATRDADEVTLRIADNGIGIPPDKLPHVFDLFEQGARSLERAEGGLGIGLTVVKTLVELHGGRVEAASAGVGSGSEFVVRLPAAAPVPRAAHSPERAAQLATPGRRVLVVDDNPDIVALLSDVLTWKGFEVEVAMSGPGAIDAARAFRPEAILLDIGIPGFDGYEVARRLRSDPMFEATRLIALTGYGQQTDRERAHAAGFHHHLVKPPGLDELLSYLDGVRPVVQMRQ